MTFWCGVLVGLVIGVPVGMAAMSLVVMAGRWWNRSEQGPTGHGQMRQD